MSVDRWTVLCQGCQQPVVYGSNADGQHPGWRDPKRDSLHHCLKAGYQSARPFRPEWDCGLPEHHHRSTPVARRCADEQLHRAVG